MFFFIFFITLSEQGERIIEEVGKGATEFIEEVKEISKSTYAFIDKHADPKSWKEYIMNLHVVQILIKLVNELVNYIAQFLKFILDQLPYARFQSSLQDIYKKNAKLRKENEEHIQETMNKYNDL